MKVKKLKILGVAALTATFLMSCNQDSEVQTQEAEMIAPSSAKVIPGQYIVVYKKDFSRSAENAKLSYEKSQENLKSQTLKLMADTGLKGEILNVYSKTLSGAALKLSPEGAEALRNREEIAYVEEDKFITYAPPSWAGGGDDTSTGEEVPYGITRVNGGVSYTGSNVAWVVDTGIDLDHEDLNVDASRGFNAFTSGKDGKSLDDGNGHGSHVAGTIAALDNEVGVVGVAAGASVIPVKVLDSRGSGSYSGVIAGIDFVGANGSSGDVANMSLGGPVSQAVDDAVKAASANGIKFVLAAGNESDDANNHSPARVNGSNIYTISAMDSSDNWASFSNFGNPPVDFAAPGVAIKSTWKDGGYNTISGTSMAAPHAAGVILLGNFTTEGTVNNDPDGNPDSIIVH
ncbi:S8 family peptidase [Christiangramia sediminis]|uniref:S8 family peptidase n=1 Tax=Christiangramia sediminis TaxID=2881336 RepID=A0A9X1LIK2_9FLAO|nr:S8 family peptidase [Christiangramia sediminis]MCB7481061.1 S8 family peptidase [Christiangramia sediminis]